MAEKSIDERYMKTALSLAERGCGFVSPNPMVGCVIVKDGRIIGRGYHKKYGGAHAERNALKSCRSSPAGATLYVTLEPCRHHGNTPPCTDAILESGITRVVVGCLDPNPLMSGGSARLLRERGIEVTTGVLERECRKLNEVFFHYITTKTPFVIMKYAMTSDGKTATKTGASRWITGEAARYRVHLERRRCTAVMVGVGTVLLDDPALTCRIDGPVKNPVRIVCDTALRTPVTSKLVTTACKETPTIIATSCEDAAKHKPYIDAGCEIINVPKKDGHIDLNALMALLGTRKIDSVLLEGGGTLNWSALRSGIVNKVHTYIAPKIFGGSVPSPVGGEGVETPDGAFFLKTCAISVLGGDVLIESEVIRGVHGDN